MRDFVRGLSEFTEMRKNTNLRNQLAIVVVIEISNPEKYADYAIG
jgi:hypothetical protein